MKNFLKLLFITLFLLTISSCKKEKSLENKLDKKREEIAQKEEEINNEEDAGKAISKKIKLEIKKEELKETVQNYNDVVDQIKQGGKDSIKAAVNKIKDVYKKIKNEEEVDRDKVIEAYGISSAMSLLEDVYDDEPVFELCDEFNDYIEDIIEGEDVTKKIIKIETYLEIIDSYKDSDYERLYNKIVGAK